MWLIAHDYKLHLWGWTLWRVLVVVGTAYVIYLLINPDIPQLPGPAGLTERIGAVLGKPGRPRRGPDAGGTLELGRQPAPARFRLTLERGYG